MVAADNAPMTSLEVAIWSCMAGGLLTVCLASLCDAALNRSADAFLGFSFVALLGLYAVLLCGLLQFFFPATPMALVRVLQVGLGPLCCALALVYTGRWLHVKSEDPWITKIAVCGSAAMGLVTVALVLFTVVADSSRTEPLLAASAGACLLTIVLTGICAWRAALLGDRLAIWVAPAAMALTTTLTGLFAQAARPGILPLPFVAVTAFSAVAYLTIIAALSTVRTRQAKRLERLAGLHLGLDPATGLPTGSALIAKVSDAFWRASRNGMACNVVCMHLHNLYDLGDLAGHGVEQQIALAMSARIRRALGFRCIVGLYHARCFVAVIQVPHQSSSARIESYVQRLRYLISKPMRVSGHAQTLHQFVPEWGIAVVSTNPNDEDSSAVLRKAEREAMRSTQPAALTA